MKYVEGTVITRDHVFTACGVDKTDAREILIELWKEHAKNNEELLTPQEFLNSIQYKEGVIGTGKVEPIHRRC